MQRECLAMARKKREGLLREKRAQLGAIGDNLELHLEAAKDATCQVRLVPIARKKPPLSRPRG